MMSFLFQTPVSYSDDVTDARDTNKDIPGRDTDETDIN